MSDPASPRPNTQNAGPLTRRTPRPGPRAWPAGRRCRRRARRGQAGRVPSSLATRSRACSSAHAASPRARPRRRRRRRTPRRRGGPRAAEHDRHVHRAGAGLDRALARDVLRPHREAHRPQLGRVAHAGVDDQRPHPRAMSDVASSSPNMPWVDGAVLVTTSTSPASAHLDRGVDHQVVAGVARHGDGRAGQAGALLDRAQVGPAKPRRPMASCTVAVPRPPSASSDVRVGPLDGADDDVAGGHGGVPLPGAGRRGRALALEDLVRSSSLSPAASRYRRVSS